MTTALGKIDRGMMVTGPGLVGEIGRRMTGIEAGSTAGNGGSPAGTRIAAGVGETILTTMTGIAGRLSNCLWHMLRPFASE